MSVVIDTAKLGFWRARGFERLADPEESVARALAALKASHGRGVDSLWVLSAGIDSPDLVWLYGMADTEANDVFHPLGAWGVEDDQATARNRFDQVRSWVTLDAVFGVPEERPFSSLLRDTILADLARRRFLAVVKLRPASDPQILAALTELDHKSRVGRLDGRADYASAQYSTEVASARSLDLTEALNLGGWEVAIRVGTPDDAPGPVAELVAAALSVPGLAFRTTRPHAGPLTLAAAGIQPSSEPLLSSYQVGLMIRPPQRELPGVALGPEMPYDINPEPSVNDASTEVSLGFTLDSAGRPATPFEISLSALNRHAFICGATGSGKTQTAKLLLEELTRVNVPWLVIEPAKSEYRAMPARLRAAGLDPEVTVIRVGDPSTPPLSVNPLEPQPGFPLQTHVDIVAALFVAAFSAEEPFPQILNAALRRCYTELGWDLTTGDYKAATFGRPPVAADEDLRRRRYPNLADLQRAAYRVIDEVGYGQEVRSNILGYVDVRLSSLRIGTPGRFFQDGHPLDLDALYRRNVVIEIEDVGNDLDKAFVIGTAIMELYEYLRVTGAGYSGELRHVTLVEEAHRLLRRHEPGTKPNQAVELFGAMLSEVRAFGEGIVVAEQIPAKILPDVIKNTAVQVVHRLPSAEDRTVLAGATNMSEEQSAYVLSLRPGQAAAFREGMDAPVLLEVTYKERHETSGPVEVAPGLLTALVARPRNLNCGDACRDAPCTARQLAVAARTSDRSPLLGFWTELCFLLAVSGHELPFVRDAWRNDISRDVGGEVRHCLIASEIEDAIEARWSQLADFHDPTQIAARLFEIVDRTLRGHGTPGDPDPDLLAGRFLAQKVHAELTDHIRNNPADDSPWPQAHRYRARGLNFPATSARRQLEWLGRSPAWTYTEHHRLLAGMAPPAVGRPTTRLTQAVSRVSGGTFDRHAIEHTIDRITDDQATIMAVLDEIFPDLRPSTLDDSKPSLEGPNS